MPRLVANILCHNDLVYLKNLIPQVEKLFDRIIVIDDVSEDGTKEFLEKRPKIEHIIHKFEMDFSKQRNVALDMVDDGDWVFRIDSDEVLTSHLMMDLRGVVRNLEGVGVDRGRMTIYHMVALNMTKVVVGKEVRLFKKNHSCHWAKPCHEELRATFTGGLIDLPNWIGLIHFKYLDALKIHLARTFSVENNLYDKDDLENRIKEDFIFLPPFIDYEINDELKEYLCTQNT